MANLTRVRRAIKLIEKLRSLSAPLTATRFLTRTPKQHDDDRGFNDRFRQEQSLKQRTRLTATSLKPTTTMPSLASFFSEEDNSSS